MLWYACLLEREKRKRLMPTLRGKCKKRARPKQNGILN
uniref:Uncharacterized protein n=1 Tax=Anguilla anguilla TaxID=7936 RepID=A0A0E9VPU9_ANGAN